MQAVSGSVQRPFQPVDYFIYFVSVYRERWDNEQVIPFHSSDVIASWFCK